MIWAADEETNVAVVYGPTHLGDGIDGPGRVPSADMQVANARLIAAAPDLLADRDRLAALVGELEAANVTLRQENEIVRGLYRAMRARCREVDAALRTLMNALDRQQNGGGVPTRYSPFVQSARIEARAALGDTAADSGSRVRFAGEEE
jgi:hypothetical protein